MELSAHTRQTDRLLLAPLTSADTADVFRVYGDPATWAHLPAGRFSELAQAEHQVAASERSFRARGLGTWAVRVAAEGATTGLPEGAWIGSGGLQYLEDAGVWNLGYRLSPEAWGRSFATELARAAVTAGAQVAPAVPITARALVNNPASTAVLEKLGLTLVWEGERAGGEGAGSRTLLSRVYADRPLTATAFDWLVAHA